MNRGLIVIVVAGLVAGCASFNDTVVIDVGDQFELLRLQRDGAQPAAAVWRDARGFECRFLAHTQRTALFGREREIEGTVRCVAITDTVADAPSTAPSR